MKKFAALTTLAAAALTLSACGNSEDADQAAKADNVEMPAEEAVGDIDATPVADPSALPGADTATDAAATK